MVEDVLGRVLYASAPDADDAVEAGASLLAADAGQWPAVGRVLLRRAEQLVRQAWERGWQPADVVRMARRTAPDDARPTRLAVDLIAAEARRYAPGALDPRWEGQLRELGAEAWWTADDRFLTELGGREAMDRFPLAEALLDVLRLLFGLPAIEPVGPVPGTSGRRATATAPASAAPSGTAGEPKMLGRIRALLAKAEATDYPEEAEALTGKAQQLMARHSIDEALLAAGAGAGPEGAPEAVRIGVDRPYESTGAMLLDAVAEANRCRAVWNEDLGFSTVVGFATDLESVELLYTSLLVQATAAMTRAEAGQRTAGRKRTKTFRQSFLLGYANRIRQRLSAATERTVAESATELGERLLPVLAARDVAVAGAAEQMFPVTTRHSVRGARDVQGWHEGTAAADRASLGGR
ncbi:DUF2786 domain-containing protein [Streptomyces sp. NPDC001922]|uniref:DUF2786 domain-containing protein n=1 Tax=Streptomyces sp. NPDC001922 TaxID=3364624 RepID=UPI0036B85441